MNKNKMLSKLRLIDKVCMIISVSLFLGLLWWSDWDVLSMGRLTAANYFVVLLLKYYLVTEYEKLLENSKSEGNSCNDCD